MSRHKDILENYIIRPYLEAVTMLFNLPFLSHISDKDKFRYDVDVLTACYIPVVGLSIGLLTYLFSLLIFLITGTLVATIICPFIILIFIEYLSYGKDSKNLVDLITLKLSLHSDSNNEQLSPQNNFMYFYVFIGLFVVRLLCIGSIIYFHRFGWLNVVFILVVTIQGYLIVEEGNTNVTPSNRNDVKMWIIATILCLIFGGVYFFSMVFALIVVILVSIKLKNIMYRKGYLDSLYIGMVGKGAEIIILLFGLFYRFHF